MNPQANSRIRLMGKVVKNIDFATHAQQLLNGNEQRRIPAMTRQDISTQLGVSRPSLNKYLSLATQHNINTPKRNKVIVSREFHDQGFLNDPLIIKWCEKMDSRSRGGKKFGGKKGYLAGFYAVCKTLKVAPIVWITGANDDQILENGRTLMTNFMTLYMQKKAAIRYTSKWDMATHDPAYTAYHFSKTVRDFMKIIGRLEYPAGENGVMSQSISQFHGKYADLKISEDLHQTFKQRFIKDYGIHSNEYRFYALGVEAFPRHQALLKMPSRFESVTTPAGKHVYLCHVYESKTSHKNNGKWQKFIFDTDLQKSIKAISESNDTMFDVTSYSLFSDKMIKILHGLYREHQLEKTAQSVQGRPDTSYYIKKPIHVLRHIGVQRLLRATNWNIGFVASCGWNKASELTDSYGKMSAEQQLEVVNNIDF